MAFKLLPFDKELLNQFSMKLSGAPIGFPKGGNFAQHFASGSATTFIVPFQFPLVISSDNKGVEYEEKNLKNIEPIAIFKGSKAREITLKWTYVATNHSDGRNAWSPNFIARTVKRIRAFFYQMIQHFVKGYKIAVDFRGYDIIGSTSAKDEVFTFRTDGVTVSHSDTIVGNKKIGFYAQQTDMEMKLKLWSGGQTEDGEEAFVKLDWLKDVGLLTDIWR